MDIQWRCSTRASNIDSDLAKMMLKAGCKMISIGLECGSHEVLEKIGKNYNLDDITVNLYDINKLDIEIRVSLTFGYNEENIKTYVETIKILNKLKPSSVAFFFLKIYPGTLLYKQALNEKFISNEYWFSDEHAIPYFEKYKSYSEFINIVKPYILNQIKAHIKKVYNDERDDSEYYFEW
jgi:radical SAM superfamily enzyme YgiQ (UPF0313 family)